MPSQRTERIRRKASYAAAVAGDLASRASQRLAAAPGGRTLAGDRWVEWSFCMARMADGPGTTLDFGADIGFLSLAAAQRGHHVVALDRLPPQLTFEHPRVEPLQGDILERPLGARSFDQIINCSSVEHVGVGGRYDSFDAEDGDVAAMAILADAMKPDGRHVITIPVGRDGVFAPYHRVYGEERLPRLLERYETEEEQYWVKRAEAWEQSERAEALQTESSESFYSVGLFVLRPR
jgi:SAM-dependent methyltransferase